MNAAQKATAAVPRAHMAGGTVGRSRRDTNRSRATTGVGGRGMQSDDSRGEVRRPLQPVPDPADPKLLAELEVDGEEFDTGELFVVSPENHLVAGLLNSTTAEAGDILRLVEDDDIEMYLAGTVVTIIRTLVDAGLQPTPQAVIARARGPLDGDRPSFQRVAEYVAKAYTMRMPISTWCDAAQVVEDAYRRSFATIGQRMEQMAESFADVEDIEQLTGSAVRRWRTTRSRMLALRERARESNIVTDEDLTEPAPEE